MTEEKKDVNPVQTESSTEQEGVKQPETVTPEQVQVTPTEEGETQPVVEPVDEQGVPWKNRAMEYQRKFNELSQGLPVMVKEQLQEVLKQQQPTTPENQYTVEQLEAFAQTQPEYRPWAEAQKEKIRQQNMEKLIREQLSTVRSQEEAVQKKQRAEQYVVTSYPEAFVKDTNGNIQGYDFSNPLVREMQNIMQDPRLKNDPEGIQIAADIAFARLSRQSRPLSQQKQQKLQSQVKKLEKQVLVEGGGRSAQTAKSPLQAAQERFAQTGKTSDAKAAVGEVLRGMGLIKD